jgi:hypothetical protein
MGITNAGASAVRANVARGREIQRAPVILICGTIGGAVLLIVAALTDVWIVRRRVEYTTYSVSEPVAMPADEPAPSFASGMFQFVTQDGLSIDGNLFQTVAMDD